MVMIYTRIKFFRKEVFAYFATIFLLEQQGVKIRLSYPILVFLYVEATALAEFFVVVSGVGSMLCEFLWVITTISCRPTTMAQAFAIVRSIRMAGCWGYSVVSARHWQGPSNSALQVPA